METAVSSNHRIRFRNFELDLDTRELYRDGVRLKAQGQPIGILEMLVEHPGELVTREDLRKALWPADTYVDFDHSLNAAVMKLRDTLGDTAEDPVYIETIPKRGYRFIAPLEQTAPVLNNANAAGELHAQPVPKEGTQEETGAYVSSNYGGFRGNSTRGHWMVLAGIALLVAACGAFWHFSLPSGAPRISYKKLTQDGHDKILAGTDGSRLYFTDGSRFSIHQLSVTGGVPSPVPSAESLGLAAVWDVSRDGSNLLVVQRELGLLPWEMWIVSTVGESQRHLGAAVHGAFSPDGQSVVYSTYKNELWTIRADGSGVHKLADTPGLPRNLAWRPDGAVIRFTIDNRYWEIRADGSNLHQWLSGWKPSFQQCCGRWSFDGASFIFLAGEGIIRGYLRSSGAQIWMLDERPGLFRKQTSEPIQLSTGPMSWDSPIPSRDGKIIFAEGRARLGELVRVDPRSKQVQPFLNGISAEFVSFSPDGKSISYVTFPDGIAWRAEADGSYPVQLSVPDDYAINPVWSPDGSQILYTGASRSPYRIHLISADGGDARLLMSDAGDPRWSPDGRSIVLAIRKPDPGNRRLVIMELATNSIRDIPGSSGMASPRWSPDGRYIAALSAVPPALRVLDLKTGQWATIQIDGDINFPAWSHDSRYIYGLAFDTIRGNRSIFRVPVVGGRPEQVLSLNDWKLTGWCGFSLTLDPSDAPLLLREIGSSEIYALTLERK